MAPKPISELSPGGLKSIRVVMTDIDDTLTIDGRLPAIAYHSLEHLQKAGLIVVPITGRPAGWCDMIARLWPVDGIVGENGAFYFKYDSGLRKMLRQYAQDETSRTINKARLFDIARDLLSAFPGTATASDQAYREIDVAIDFCEDVDALPLTVADQIAAFFQSRGATAKISSIHVNAWFGKHDKLSMALQMLANCFGIDKEEARRIVAYCGDSPNDSPMFGYFDASIGVANVTPFLSSIEHPPKYITRESGGYGFAAFADRLLQSR
jgi:HAD superfamily hydrolase (TIGR01484 family)